MTELGHVVCHVRDIDAAVRFYTRGVGLALKGRIFDDRLASLGYPVEGMADHTVSQRLYLRDPDGNEVELFVDDPTYDWRNDGQWMEAPVKPLSL